MVILPFTGKAFVFPQRVIGIFIITADTACVFAFSVFAGVAISTKLKHQHVNAFLQLLNVGQGIKSGLTIAVSLIWTASASDTWHIAAFQPLLDLFRRFQS